MKSTVNSIVVLSVFLACKPVCSTESPTVSKPLFHDPHYHGSCDPEIVWNEHEQQWWIFYTARRAKRKPPPPPLEIRGIDAYNDFLVSKCEGLTYEEVVQCWRSARRELEEALTDAPPEKLHERAQFPWGETGNITRLVSILAEHEREHADEILELVSGEDYPEDEEE